MEFRPLGDVDARPERIAFLGTYPPRRCGIATFTRDLAAGISAADEQRQAAGRSRSPTRAAQYEYPPEVEYEIRQGTKGDYARAAELVELQRRALGVAAARVRHLRRRRRRYVLDFLGALRVPAVVTLHTVLEQAVAVAARDRAEDGQGVRVLVVMSQVAADLLARRYELRERDASRSSRTASPTWRRATRRRSRRASASPGSACC